MTVRAFGRDFVPPRQGSWEIDLTHFPRPATRYGSELFIKSFMPGFAEGTRLYGLLLQGLDYVDVNSFMYVTRRSVGAPERSKGPPPRAIFKLLTWLHPEIRRRLRRSAEAVEQRAWLEDLRYWDEVVKPSAIAEHLAIQKVDLDALDAAGLAAHIRAATENADNAVYRHGRFSLTAYLPVGDYLTHAMAWTGEPLHALLLPVKGFSEISNGTAAPEMSALVSLLKEDADARGWLDDGDAAAIIDRLRRDGGRIGAATRAWIDIVGYRIVTGYDLSDLTALELPDILLGSLKAGLAPAVEAPDGGSIEAYTTQLREKVPAAHRATFDRLLDDARTIYRLREERDHYNDGWSTGLLRRALLHAGSRLAESGRVSDPEYLLDTTRDEVQAMLLSTAGPSDHELAERTRWRRTANAAEVPQHLGLPKPAALPKEWLPPHQVRLVKALETFLSGLFAPGEDTGTAQIIKGLPVSSGVYEGTARVVLKSDQFGDVRQGDVLVARSTSPYFNVLLPMLGGIVTDHGGALSHAAIVSREYGIPGVVGAKSATKSICNGDRVRINGDTGEVHVLNRTVGMAA